MDLFDYLENQFAGFDEEPFNPVDSAVLSQFCNVVSKGVMARAGAVSGDEGSPKGGIPASFELQVPGNSWRDSGLGPVNFSDYLDVRLFDGMFEGLDAQNVKHELFLLASSPRFRDLGICGYADVFDESNHAQFSATTFVYRDEWAYVGFRGTDGSFAGWREDFDMAVNPPVAAQQLAVTYLEHVAGFLPRRLYVGGHSKGGNLATYAAIRCSEPVRDRISMVYDHDGPGFKSGFVSEGEFDALRGRIHRTVPEDSVVGQIMDTSALTRPVKSCEWFVNQHSIFSWEVSDGMRDFGYAIELSKSSRLTHQILDEWIGSLEKQDLPRMVDVLFRTIEASGVENPGKVFAGDSGAIRQLLDAALGMDEETREVLVPALTSLATIAARTTTQGMRGSLRRKQG